MTERQICKALKLIQKRTMRSDKLTLICQKLVDMGLASPGTEDGITSHDLTIKGKIFIWDHENWRLTS